MIEPWRQSILEARQVCADRGDRLFLGIPDDWFENPRYRCADGHVRREVLKSEEMGRDACLVCFSPCALTHPADVDGPFDMGKALAWKLPGMTDGKTI